MLKFKKFLGTWKFQILTGGVIFLLALFLRIYNLTIIPVFGDEAIYIRWSQVMGAVPSLRFLPLSDGKQPLFMWILMFLVPRFSDPLWIGRIVSVVSGMGTVVGIGVLTFLLLYKRRQNKQTIFIALVASLFWAISPFALFYDRLALVDSLLTFWGVWTFALGVLVAKTLRLDLALIIGFILGGALLTKSPGFIILALYPFTYIVSNWPSRARGKLIGKTELTHLIKLIILSTVTFSVAYLFYNVLRLGDNFHMIALRNKDYIYPLNQPLINPLFPLKGNINLTFEWVWRMGTGLIIVFSLLFMVSHFSFEKVKKKIWPSSEAAFLFFTFLIPILIAGFYTRTLAPRYILYALPTFYIFSALFFQKLFDKSNLLKKVLIFGLIIFSVQSLQFDYNLLTRPQKAALPAIDKEGFFQEWTAGYGIKESAEIILEEYHKNTGQKIVVGTEGYFGTLPDGLQMYLNNYFEITVIGVGIDLKELPTSLIESRNSGNSTYLLINSSRLLFKPEDYNLELVASYSKMLRTPGTRMYNLFGPQEKLYLFRLQ